MANDKITDWEDVPVENKIDDWEDVPLEAPQAPEGNPVTQAVANFTQGAAANLSDEFAGIMEAGGRLVGLKDVGVSDRSKDINLPSLAEGGPTLDWETLRDAYRAARDKERSALKQDAKERPALAATSQVAGAIVSPANKIAKGASALKQGAALGATYGFGASEDTGAGLVYDTAAGAAMGGAIGKGAEKLAPVFKKGADKIAEKTRAGAEWVSARAQGLERATARKMEETTKGSVRAVGRQGLDDPKMLSLRSNTDDMIAQNEKIKKAAMDSRAAAYDKIDDAGASQFNPVEAADEAANKVLAGKNFDHDDAKETFNLLDPHLQNIFSRGKENIPMKEAQKLVEKLGEKANFDTTRSKEANKIAKAVYNSVRKSVNDAAEKGADVIGVSGLKETIEAANKTYSTGMKATKLLANKKAREDGNKFFGLTDTIIGGTGLGYAYGTGDWQTGATVLAGKKVLEKYGAKVIARGLDRVAKSLSKDSKMAAVIQKNPAVVQAIALGLSGTPPPMSKAAGKDAPKDGGEFVAEIKGPNKWSVDGYAKLYEHDKSGAFKDPAQVEKLFSEPKAKQLLVQASGLKPGSKAMDDIYKKLQSQMKGKEQ